ncbi:hypothetical protein TSUD_100140 [Trifolium subterraneum]|uniref:Uncharacterized protein n=1 Tax=Trifolium subterraneum TaxID=3900 RepID=A0A2Z6PBV8_TRISU|nr:hypothetical protein TSUD_100140 [Trifolium subterraneum]
MLFLFLSVSVKVARSIRYKPTRVYNTRSRLRNKMSNFEEENHMLREQMTTMQTEIEKLTSMVTSLMAIQNQALAPVPQSSSTFVPPLVSSAPLSTPHFVMPEGYPWGMPVGFLGEESHPVVSEIPHVKSTVPIPQLVNTLPQVTATVFAPLVHTIPQTQMPIFHAESVGGYDRMDDLQIKYDEIQKEMRALRGKDLFGQDAHELCLVPDVVVPHKFKVPDFEKYKVSTCPKAHLIMYARKMSTQTSNDKLLIHYFQDSLTGAALRWYMDLDRANVSCFNDLASAFIRQYNYNSYLAPDRDELRALAQKERKSFKEYAQRWRELAAQIRPPVEEKELCKLFLHTLSPFFYEKMVGIVSRSFTEMVEMGMCLEEGVRQGRLIRENAPTNIAKKYGNSFSKKKESEVGMVAQGGPQSRYPTYQHMRPPPPVPAVLTTWYRSDLTCAFHQGAPGHDVERCYAFKKAVQELIRNKVLSFKDENPNVRNNPLPNHGSSIHFIQSCQETSTILSVKDIKTPLVPIHSKMCEVKLFSHDHATCEECLKNPQCSSRVQEDIQRLMDKGELVVTKKSEDVCVIVPEFNVSDRLEMIYNSGEPTVTPLVIYLPGPMPYTSLRAVPYRYDATMLQDGVETPIPSLISVDNIADNSKILRSGRILLGTVQGKTNDSVEKTQIPDSSGTGERVYEDSDEVLKMIKRSEYKIVDQLLQTPSKISILSLLMNSDAHREALMKVLDQAYVDHDTTFDKLAYRGAPLRPSALIVKAFDGSRKSVIGEIDLPISVGPYKFQITFQVMDIRASYSCLLGRPWIHEAGAVTSTLHQKLKFVREGKLVVVNGEEALLVSHLSAFSYIGADVEDGTAFQGLSIEERSSEKAKAPMKSVKDAQKVMQGDEASHWGRLLQLAEGQKKEETNAIIEHEDEEEPPSFVTPGRICCNWVTVDVPSVTPLSKLSINKPVEHDDPRPSPNFEFPVYEAVEEEDEEIPDEIRRLLDQEKRTIQPHKEDMPGLDPEIVEHHLPLKPECPPWLANVVPVPKKDGKVRMCVDYRDLNKASPKDDFPLPHIDVLVDNTAKSKVLSFMDDFSGYNQIKMAVEDREKTTFHYTLGHFLLQNDMIVKSGTEEEHVEYLSKMFQRLRKYRLRLNPNKCTFGVRSGKLLGFIVSQKGIEVDPDKVRAIREMPAPQTEKQVRGFLGRLNYISRFISHMTATCGLIFKLLRKNQGIVWTEDCQKAFDSIKEYLMEPPILIPPVEGRPLIMYLTVLEESMGCVLGQQDETGRKEHAIYYLSKKFTDCESRYSMLEKTCCALAWAAKPLTGRIARWQMLLSEYDIEYRTQKAIKDEKDCDEPVFGEGPDPESQWGLIFDGAVNLYGSGIGAIIVTPKGAHIPFTARLQFECTNNIAEYEACIMGIEEAIDLRIKNIDIYGDSTLVINQIKGEWETRHAGLIPYRDYARRLLTFFNKVELHHIPRDENQMADALATLSSMYRVNRRNEIPTINIRCLERPAYMFAPEEVVDDKPWKCHKCQIYADKMHLPPTSLNVLSSPWSFSMWGIDMIGRIEPKASNGHRFILVAIDYFTKWVEAASYANVTKQVVVRFIKNHIICRYGVPNKIITDNGTNLNNKMMKDLCDEFKIEHHNSSPYRPQMNGAVEAANKNIKKIVQKMVVTYKDWHEMLPFALHGYCTSVRTSTGATPFSLVYGMEAVLPVEVEIPSMRVLMETELAEAEWCQNRYDQLNLIQEKRMAALCHGQLYQKRMKQAFDRKVRPREFREGDLVLKRILSFQPDSRGKWMPNYEGPYVVKRAFSGGAMTLATMDGDELPRPINADPVKKYFV